MLLKLLSALTHNELIEECMKTYKNGDVKYAEKLLNELKRRIENEKKL